MTVAVATAEELKARVQREIDAHRGELVELSHRIHANPELGFQEERAAGWLTEYLGGRGFAVTRGICDLPTAFRAAAGEGHPVMGLLAEYDALPGLGHGCGHNLIAASSAGAAVGLRAVLGELTGAVVLLGTPAEEVYGGKVVMAQRGAFADLDVAMLVHPGSRNTAVALALALVELDVEYHGRASHAAARPEAGVNALDALVVAYTAVSALRQQVRPSARIHGIITDGGQAPNIIPEHSAAVFLVRADDDAYLEELKEKVLACFRAGAEATGARLEFRWGERGYSTLRTNLPLAAAYRRNVEALGREIYEPAERVSLGSTDMGNVSALVPAIHPSIAVSPPAVPIHSREFAAYAGGPEGDRALIDAAKALAMTAVDYLTDAALRQEVKRAFRGGS